MATFNDTSISVSINIGRNEIDREDMEACVNARVEADRAELMAEITQVLEAHGVPYR